MNGFGYDRSYGDEWNKFVKSVTLYGKSGNNYVYADATYTKKVSKDDLLALCMANVVVVNYGGTYIRPAAFKVNDTKGCIDLVLWNAAATSPAAITLYSEEYK